MTAWRRVALATLALGCARGAARAQDAPFARVAAALAHADVAGAEAAARETLEGDTVPGHRLDALVALANLAWRVHRDTASGARFVRRILDLPLRDARAVGLIQQARADLAFHHLADAMLHAREAVSSAANLRDRIVALDVLARAVLEPTVADPLAPVDRAAVMPIIAELRQAAAAAPGELTVALNLLMAGVVARDGPAVLAGWEAYYLLLTNRGSTNVLRDPRDALRRVVPRWSLATDTRLRRALVLALADSRFFGAAAYLARAPLADRSTLEQRDPRAHEIVAYAEFLTRIERETNEYYRLTALHAGNERAWRDSLDAAARATWPSFAWAKGSPVPAFSFDRFLSEAGRRFGLVANFGATGGFRDAHIGHIVSDERHQVTQWGHTAAFRFVQLDHVASNGFLSWFGDGRRADGGWTNASMVAQVRPSYTLEPSVVWESLADSASRASLDRSIAADSASDLERARLRPIAYFPSVPRRLDRAGELALLDSLRGLGLSRDALRERFVRQLSAETQAFSIFQHEGRHAIDQSMGTPVEPEFTAKLAQVEFGPRPQTAFRGIMTPSVGDDTPHGRADSHVLRGLLAWMSDHASEIKHLDRQQPLLPQVPLLTGSQLRRAFRSMDPLAPRPKARGVRLPLLLGRGRLVRAALIREKPIPVAREYTLPFSPTNVVAEKGAMRVKVPRRRAALWAAAPVIPMFLWWSLRSTPAPAPPPVQLQVSLSTRQLDVIEKGAVVTSYGVAVGRPGHPTPTGSFKTGEIVWNPSWKPPAVGWARGKKPEPSGSPLDPMVGVKIYFQAPDYYIHGTNDPKSIGEAASHGCIRMVPDDAVALAHFIQSVGGHVPLQIVN